MCQVLVQPIMSKVVPVLKADGSQILLEHPCYHGAAGQGRSMGISPSAASLMRTRYCCIALASEEAICHSQTAGFIPTIPKPFPNQAVEEEGCQKLTR